MIGKLTISLLMSVLYVGLGFFWYHDKVFGGICKKLLKNKNRNGSVAMNVFKYSLMLVFAFLLTKLFLYEMMISYRYRFGGSFWYEFCVMFNVLVGVLGVQHFRENKPPVLLMIDATYHVTGSICAIVLGSYLYGKF